MLKEKSPGKVWMNSGRRDDDDAAGDEWMGLCKGWSI